MMIRTFHFCFAVFLLIVFPHTSLAVTPGKSTLDLPTIFFDYSVDDGRDELLILADVPLKKYRSFMLDKPPRLVFDVHGVSLLEKVVGLPINRAELKRIRIARHPDKVRFVFDLGEQSIEHQVMQVEKGLKVIITPAAKKTKAKGKKKGTAQKASATKKAPPQPSPIRFADYGAIFGNKRITILFHKAPLPEFFTYVASKTGLAISVDPACKGLISLQLTDVTLSLAVQRIVRKNKLRLVRKGKGIKVLPPVQTKK